MEEGCACRRRVTEAMTVRREGRIERATRNILMRASEVKDNMDELEADWCSLLTSVGTQVF